MATVRAQSLEAQRTVENNEELSEKGLISEFELANSRDRAEELVLRLEIERQRLDVMSEAEESRLAAQRAQVERLRSIAEFRQALVESGRKPAPPPSWAKA